MVINQDHDINRVYHDARTYELTMAEFGTDYVIIGARILYCRSTSHDRQGHPTWSPAQSSSRTSGRPPRPSGI
jgi:hypothetical protein